MLSALFSIEILENKLSPVEKVCNLGFMFDAGFSFQSHINQIHKQCSYHIHDLTQILCFLSKSVEITIANAMVSSRLDYCNSLLYGISVLELRRLQGTQNTLCRIITKTPRYSSVTDHLKTLQLSLNYVLSPTKPWSLVCHHISVHSLYHIVIL